MTRRRIDFDDPQRSGPSNAQGSGVRMSQRRRNKTPREHGWARQEDKRSGTDAAPQREARMRPATGMPLLLFTALGVLTFVGIARVKARVSVLEIADDITDLTKERDELLDRRRRLQAERAYLRHPDRVRERATKELGMVPASSERIQNIQLLAATKEQP